MALPNTKTQKKKENEPAALSWHQLIILGAPFVILPIVFLSQFISYHYAANAAEPTAQWYGTAEPNPIPSEVNQGKIDAGFSYQRVLLNWKYHQSTKTGFHWNDNEINQFSHPNDKLILVLKTIPSFAAEGGRECGPILSSEMESYATFLKGALERYKDKPIAWLEVGNEPDYNPQKASGTPAAWTTCYGASPQAYGKLLKRSYEVVKAFNTTFQKNVQVAFGGVAYDDCYVSSGPAATVPNNGAGMAFNCNFVSEVYSSLKSTDGTNPQFPFIDAIAFHQYTDFVERWRGYGGEELGKLSYLKAQLAAQGVSKPFLVTEYGIASHGTDQWTRRSETLQSAGLLRLLSLFQRKEILGTVQFRLTDQALVSVDATTGRVVDEKNSQGQVTVSAATQCAEGWRWGSFGLYKTERVKKAAESCSTNPLKGTYSVTSGKAYEAKPSVAKLKSYIALMQGRTCTSVTQSNSSLAQYRCEGIPGSARIDLLFYASPKRIGAFDDASTTTLTAPEALKVCSFGENLSCTSVTQGTPIVIGIEPKALLYTAPTTVVVTAPITQQLIDALRPRTTTPAPPTQPPALPPTPVGDTTQAETQWRVSYFPTGNPQQKTDINLAGQNDQPTSTSLLLRWGSERPSGVSSDFPTDNWSARFARRFQMAAGRYTVTGFADDNVTVTIGGETVIQNSGYGSWAKEFTASTDGVRELVVLYNDIGGSARMDISFVKIPTPAPPQTTTPTASAWNVSFFGTPQQENMQFTGTPASTTSLSDLSISSLPSGSLRGDKYSVLFERLIPFEANKTYTFSGFVDDTLFVEVDGTPLIGTSLQNPHPYGDFSVTKTFTTTPTGIVKVYYRQDGGGSGLVLNIK